MTSGTEGGPDVAGICGSVGPLGSDVVAAVVSEPGETPFVIGLSTMWDYCDGSGTWVGWDALISFPEGAPKPGVYDFGADEQVSTSGSKSMDETAGTPWSPTGVIVVEGVYSDGAIDATICGAHDRLEGEFHAPACPSPHG